MLSNNSEVFSRSRELEKARKQKRIETSLSMAILATTLVTSATVAGSLSGDIKYLLDIDKNKNADEALELYEDTAIALVPYEMDTEDATALGEKFETAFNTFTDGLISIDVTVVEPSAQATQKYQEINSENCVGMDKKDTYGSYIADTAMPELSDFDKIIGLNADPACEDSMISGIAQLHGRHAELFNTADAWDAIVANGGKQEVRHEVTENSSLISYLISPVDTSVHETLHLFGLGHSSSLNTPPGTSIPSEPLLRLYSQEPRKVSFNMRDSIAERHHREYGGRGLMGHGSLTQNPSLHTIEKYLLEWPHREKGLETKVKTYVVTDEPLVFDSENLDESIVLYSLDTPLSISTDEGSKEVNTFAMVPRVNQLNLTQIEGFDAYLLDDHNNFIDLNQIANFGHENTIYSIKFDDQTLSINLDYDNNRMIVFSGDTQKCPACYT